jgi:hypothetical protein
MRKKPHEELYKMNNELLIIIVVRNKLQSLKAIIKIHQKSNSPNYYNLYCNKHI